MEHFQSSRIVVISQLMSFDALIDLTFDLSVNALSVDDLPLTYQFEYLDLNTVLTM